MTLTTLLAVYAAILSTTTGVAQVITFLRDRSDIKLSSQRVTETFEVDGIMGAGETVTVISVVNAGRRPVTITNVGAVFLFPKSSFTDLVCSPTVPTELTEGKQLTAVAEDEQIDLAEVEAWEVIDAIGNTYRKSVAPFFPRVRSRLRRRFARH